MTLDRLVLWRHGETEYNAVGRIQGHLDSVLTSTGHEQARRAAPLVAGFRPDVVLSSDLQRASATAEAFAEVSGPSVRLDKRLRETHLGEWQGLNGAEVEHGWPGAMGNWRAKPTWAPPGGESRVEVAERAREVVEELDLTHSGTALLCTHGGLITGLTARLLDWPTSLWPGLGGVSNCHWAVLARRSDGDQRWRLMTYNGGVPE
ncbi:2,3-bisphosphoglycerate-dependent phosphoglycerate mutase/probable phosphoglycerate mutase [Saccharopolyspora lacisalsi]|uniref:2,3-bisphosphoglycerate-dependent phosphoglycerate mutase/probable phosphoglycerate mutase n=1 Tax=Halosaccharopolyspora lacisalsi TaxID=1000566 RepID=A0A839DYV3_9PSEU|nr:histidine phosphatase family protein [Halosaccharopolyspora lacisalsi]MBA8825406.1 2,3-bisphosphoglycerate-dependent phosphoglycerate mutase/probable phosphoglycerate mutase [Halosaccharopolyspora lacisalsi]